MNTIEILQGIKDWITTKLSKVVSVTAQTFTDAEKKQARANLGFGNGDIDNEPTANSNNLVKSGGVYNALARKQDLTPTDEQGFHIIDENLNVGMKYDEDGLDVAKVSSHFVGVLKASGISADDVMSSYSSLTNEDGFFITDEELNIGVKVDSNGIHAKNILEYEIVEN